MDTILATQRRQIFSDVLLAISVAATVLAFFVVIFMRGSGISGAALGYRYYSVGIEQHGSRSFILTASAIEKLARRLPATMQVAGVSFTKLRFASPNQPNARHPYFIGSVTGNYFHTLHITPIAGRVTNVADERSNARVVVLNGKVADRLFGSAQAAVGHDVLVSLAGLPATLFHVVGVVPGGYHGVGAQMGISTSAWMPFTASLKTTRASKHASNNSDAGKTRFTPILSAPDSMSSILVATTFTSIWSRIPNFPLNATARPIVTTPFSVYSVDARLLEIRRAELYLYLALSAAVLALINAFTLRTIRFFRQYNNLKTLLVLGATRRWMVRRYFLRAFTTAAFLTLIFAVIMFILNALLEEQFPQRIGYLHWTTASLFPGILWMIPVLFLIALILELLPLSGLWIRNLLYGTGRASGLGRFKMIFGSSMIGAEILLASAMSLAAIWALLLAWQQHDLNLGMLQRPATIVILTHRSTTAGVNNSATAGIDLLHALSRAARSTSSGAVKSVGYGPTPGFPQFFKMFFGMRQYTKGSSKVSVFVAFASAGWFRAGSVELLAGHGFQPGIQESPYGIIIDAVTARTLFGGVRKAIGKSLLNHHGALLHIIGVVTPLKLDGPSRAATPILIYNFRLLPKQIYWLGGPLLLRPPIAKSSYPQLRSVIDKVLAKWAPQLELRGIVSSSRIRAKLSAPQIRQAQVFSLLALFAWAIALSGVAAHLRLYLATRKRLTALRSALGAGPSQLYRELVLGVLALAGAGVVLALLAVPWLATQFAFLSGAQVAPFGVATWIALAVLLLAVFAVVHFPARRAARAEPAESLHEL